MVPEATDFSAIVQNKGCEAIQGHQFLYFFGTNWKPIIMCTFILVNVIYITLLNRLAPVVLDDIISF